MARKRGQGEGSINRRKNGLWAAQMTVQGRRVSKYFKTQSECREWLRKIRTQIDDGLTFSGAQTNVSAFLSEWLVLTETSVRPKTIDAYKKIVRLHIDPELGRIKMKDLSPRQIQALYSKKLESGLSARSVVLIHAVLRTSLDKRSSRE